MSVASAVDDARSEKKIITEVKVVPWYNAAQFQKVYEYLYSPDITKKNWALDQITVWQTRCYPSLPGAIDVTFGLVVAFVQDELWMNGNTLDRQMNIEMNYMTAILKFVTWFLNSRKDLVKQGVKSAQVAKMLGIPSYIVDIRNEATHSIAPSLACLRLAAEDALDRLKKSYWEVEAAQVKNYVKKAPDTKEAKLLIHEYMKTKLQIMNDQMKKTTEEDSPDEINLKKHLEAIDGLIDKNKNLFIKALVMGGYFIPHDEALKELVNEEMYKLFQKPYDVNAKPSFTAASIEHSEIEHFEPSTIPEVPKLHETLWAPIIYHLNLYNAVPLFMEALLRSQGDRTIAGQKLIIAWILKILRIHNSYEYPKGSPLREIFMCRGIIVNWHSLFFSSLENPCIYTAFIFSLIVRHLNFDKEICQHFMQLFSIRVGLSNKNAPVTDRIFTVEDVLKARKLQSGKSNRSKHTLWSLVTDDSYKNLPVGTLLNPVRNEKEEVQEEDLNNEEKEFKIEYIIGNENDTEKHYFKMEIEDDSLPDKFLKDFMADFNERETFLYK